MTDAPSPDAPSPDSAHDHWFEPLAAHMGPAYLRYSFTMGTRQEVAFLVEELRLEPGMRVLDVGCGPGRHVLALAELGIEAVGVDISRRFVELGNDEAAGRGLTNASFERADARALAFDEEFDAAISLCQGAFGLGGPGPFDGDANNLGNDQAVLEGIGRALRPGGRVAVSAFSAYFQVRWLESHDTFDAATAVNHETTEVRDASGRAVPADLWTTCYTPRELRMLAERAGLVVDDIWSVTPGEYGRRAPDTELHEFLLRAHRP